MSTSLATLLLARGFSERTVGVVTTATLLGSASALLLITRFAPLLTPRRVLLVMSALMFVTGVVFGLSSDLVVLTLIALVGPLKPSSGDVSAFLPAEQTVVSSSTTESGRTMALARMSLVASSGASLGAFLAGPLRSLGRTLGFAATQGAALIPLAYAAIGLAVIPLYRRSVDQSQPVSVRSPSRLGPSKRTVRHLTALFALDSAGGGLVVYSILGLWLQRRFGFNLDRIGVVLGLMSLAAAASSLLAPRLTLKFGLGKHHGVYSSSCKPVADRCSVCSQCATCGRAAPRQIVALSAGCGAQGVVGDVPGNSARTKRSKRVHQPPTESRYGNHPLSRFTHAGEVDLWMAACRRGIAQTHLRHGASPSLWRSGYFGSLYRSRSLRPKIQRWN
jgi:hypothetical protein